MFHIHSEGTTFLCNHTGNKFPFVSSFHCLILYCIYLNACPEEISPLGTTPLILSLFWQSVPPEERPGTSMAGQDTDNLWELLDSRIGWLLNIVEDPLRKLTIWQRFACTKCNTSFSWFPAGATRNVQSAVADATDAADAVLKGWWNSQQEEKSIEC